VRSGQVVRDEYEIVVDVGEDHGLVDCKVVGGGGRR
jgi:tRNA A22 N-methylase